MNREGRKRLTGFTLAEIMVTVAIIALVAAIVIPNFLRGSRRAQANSCIANLKIIDQAKMLWAQDTDAGAASTPSWGDLVDTYIKKTPSCPAGGTYTIGNMSSVPACTEISGMFPHRLE